MKRFALKYIAAPILSLAAWTIIVTWFLLYAAVVYHLPASILGHPPSLEFTAFVALILAAEHKTHFLSSVIKEADKMARRSRKGE